MKVGTLQQIVKSVTQGSEAVWTGPANAEVNKFPSARSPNTTLCNRPDARVSRSGRASEFYEVLVASLDA
jgi:hypothetical protein